MDLITHDVRMNQWTNIIAACNTSGMTKTRWCRENGVNIKSFYYWQKRIRIASYEEQSGSRVPNQEPVAFAKVIVSPRKDPEPAENNTGAVIRVSGLHIEIMNTATEELITKLLKAASYA